MAEAKGTIRINRPVGEVFNFIARGENNPLWRGKEVEIKLTEGVSGKVGARYEQSMPGPLTKIPADYTITEVVPGKRLGFQVVAGPAHPTGLYLFSEKNGATEVVFSLEWKPSGLKKLIEPVVKKQMPKEIEALTMLKRYLEEGV